MDISINTMMLFHFACSFCLMKIVSLFHTVGCSCSSFMFNSQINGFWVNVQNQLIHCPVDGCLECFQPFALLNSTATHSCVPHLIHTYGSFSMTFQGLEWLGQRSASHDNTELFSKGVVPVCIPTQKWFESQLILLALYDILIFWQPVGYNIPLWSSLAFPY